MKLAKVDSSNIEAIGLIESQQISLTTGPVSVLRILFKNGRLYDYYGVTKELYNDFLESESKGSFFHKNINKKFKYELVKTVQE